MKRISPAAIFCAIALMLAVSCSKDPYSAPSKPRLILSKTSVKIGEPLYATTRGQDPNSKTQWSTALNGQVWAPANADSATYLFTSPGNYTITATYFSSPTTAYDSSSATVIVTDSFFTDTSTLHCNVITVNTLSPDDQINLTPVDFSDTGLIFVAHTQIAYAYSPLLDDGGGNIPPVNGSFECDFNSTLNFACFGSTSPAPAVGIVSFTQVTNGSYDLVFKLNGNRYSGTVTATDANATIVWNYASGVTISPLTIPRRNH